TRREVTVTNVRAIARRCAVSLLTGLLVFSAWSTVLAAPIVYQGDLAPGVAVTGSAGGFGWSNEDGADVGFWRFVASPGDSVTLTGTRLDMALDLAFS